jgi:hypothetical protein
VEWKINAEFTIFILLRNKRCIKGWIGWISIHTFA